MFCNAYHCKMRKEACFNRRKNAMDRKHKHCKLPGFGDLACRNCEQGAQIAAELDPKRARKYKSELRKIQNKFTHAGYLRRRKRYVDSKARSSK